MPIETTGFAQVLVDQFVAAGWWSTQTFSDQVATLARGAAADRAAYVTVDGMLSWRDYDAAADDLAAVLRDLEIAPDGFVGVFVPDTPLTHVVYLAVERAGLTIVGIGPRSGRHEIRHLLSTTQATMFLSTAELRGDDLGAMYAELRTELPTLAGHLTVGLPAVDGRYRPRHLETVVTDGADGADTRPRRSAVDRSSPAPRGPDDVFMVNATSGTTGMPKCVQHTQNRWRRFAQHAVDAGELTGDDILMSALPSPFGFGLWSAHFLPALLGAPAVLMSKWDADEALELMRAHRVSVFAGVTTQLMMVLDRLEAGAPPPTGLRVVFTGGEAVPYERARRFEELTGAAVLQFYGSNESGALSCTTVSDDRHHRLRTAGRILPEMHVELVDPATGRRIVDPGEIGQPTCWGPLMTPGYLADSQSNAALFDSAGRLRMPDLATVSADGYLTVTGRVADIIIRGGMNISAADIEAVLLEHPSVELAAVVGVPHRTFGEQVAAVVQLRPETSLTIADLRAHLSARGMAKHTWPEHLHLVAEMPRNSGEKIAKSELRARLTPPDPNPDNGDGTGH